MKQIFTLLALIVSFNTFSQTVWAPRGAFWSYTIDSFGGPQFLTITRQKEEIEVKEKKVIPLIFSYSAYKGNDFPSIVHRDTMYTYSVLDSVFIGKNKEKFQLLYDFGTLKGDSVASNLVDTLYYLRNACKSLRGYHSSRTVTCGSSTMKKDLGKAYERLGNVKGFLLPLETNCIVSEAYYKLTDYRDSTGFVYSIDPTVPCSFVTSSESEPTLEQGFTVAPNPFGLSTTLSHLTAYSSMEVVVFDAKGSEVQRSKMEHSLVLELPESGLYQVIVSHEGKVVYRTRLVKE